MISGIFFSAVAVMSCAYTILPLLRQRQAWLVAEEADRRHQALEEEKRSFLRAIRDIDFEHAAGKIDDRDHAELRDHYVSETARVIGEIDDLGSKADGWISHTVSADEQSRLSAGTGGPENGAGAAPSRIAELREELEQLEIAWEMGEIRNDAYFARRDACRAELDSLADNLQQRERNDGCA